MERIWSVYPFDNACPKSLENLSIWVKAMVAPGYLILELRTSKVI